MQEAAALMERGRFRAAIAEAEAHLKKQPNDPNAHQLLCMVASRRGRFRDAATHAEALVRCVPASPEAWCRLGSSRMYAGDHDGADEAFRRAESLRPGDASAIRGRAELAERGGDPEAGLSILDSLGVGSGAGATSDGAGGPGNAAIGDAAPVLDPLTALLRAQLLTAAKRPADAAATAEAAMLSPAAPPVVRRKLAFAAGKAHDRQRNEDAAWSAWTQANATGSHPFDADAHDADVSRTIAHFTGDERPATSRSRAISDQPILIVGMPRSGSTLVEQILDAHPAAAGTGETTALPEQMSRMHADHAGGRPFPEWWPDAPGRSLTQAGAGYVSDLAAHAVATGTAARRGPKPARLLDKNLLNLSLLGAAAHLVPEARFIVCVRHPVDNGLSCWMNDLSPNGFPWAGDLEQIARYTAAAQRLTDHWLAVLGDRVLRVDYEALVDAPADQTRRLLEFAGLPWDDACLEFHATGRAVNTNSYDQVRQPIYRSAIGRRDRYRDALAPMVDAMRALGVRNVDDEAGGAA